MDYKIIWSNNALDDIDNIANYISKDSNFYASLVVTKIFELENIILSHPRAGRIVPEENNINIREHFLYSYRIIYEILKDKIVIIAVIHGKQLLNNKITNRRN